jgi:malonyl-CoA O-methyltransferase
LKEQQLTTWKNKRKVMHCYDITAEMYDERYAEEQQRKYKKALETFSVAGEPVLDVGCGSGLFFKEVAAQAGLVIGVDISRKLLLKAKKNVISLQNTFILQADADHLPFVEDFFEAIFAFTVLQNMPKPTATLKEFKRVAKLDSRVVVTGLKKAFSLDKFMNFLDDSGMEVVAFVDEDTVNCYLAVLAT